jgi:hypothetical protein
VISSKNDYFNEGPPLYSGFGIRGNGKPSAPSFGSKRSGGGDDAADLLDNILDDIEEKKGIETSKPKSEHSNAGRLGTAKSQVI